MMFRERLIALFYNCATGSRRTRLLLTPIGPLVFLCFLLLLIGVSRWVDHLLGLPRFPGPPLNMVLSFPLLVFGTFLTSWSVATFLKGRGTPVPFNPPPELVEKGPYRWSRNPMLTGLFALLFGIGILLGSLSLTFAFTPLFIGLMVWEITAVEEPELERRLGEDYLRYRERVAMFWPRWRR